MPAICAESSAAAALLAIASRQTHKSTTVDRVLMSVLSSLLSCKAAVATKGAIGPAFFKSGHGLRSDDAGGLYMEAARCRQGGVRSATRNNAWSGRSVWTARSTAHVLRLSVFRRVTSRGWESTR